MSAQPTTPAPQPIAYSVAGAADAIGVGTTVIRGLLRTGELPKRYLHTKPIILATDLLDLMNGLPDTPQKPTQ